MTPWNGRSERLAKFATDKSVDSIARQKEGGNINKSLHSLTTVVSRLAQGTDVAVPAQAAV